jgi:putative hydrolase of the HAD superfamily
VLPRYAQPGLEAFLESLRSSGVALGVLSDYDAGPKLEALGIRQYFDVVVCAQQPEVGVFKPHPRGLQVTLERLGVSSGDALYIGDRSDVDAVAAAAAGIPCAILAAHGHAHEGGAAADTYFSISSFHDMRDRLVPT